MAVARFLRTCPGLSKSIVGDLLGQNTERCLRILDAFTHMFDFSGAASGAVCRKPACRQSWLGSSLQNQQYFPLNAILCSCKQRGCSGDGVDPKVSGQAVVLNPTLKSSWRNKGFYTGICCCPAASVCCRLSLIAALLCPTPCTANQWHTPSLHLTPPPPRQRCALCMSPSMHAPADSWLPPQA